MRRVLRVLFWSVIAAAFIGPGTVTTAGVAGANHGLALLWPLVFATVGCIVVQEASARLAIASGHSLGEAMRKGSAGSALARFLATTVAVAVILGCCAYEAGNLVGAAQGAGLAFDMPPAVLAVLIALPAALLLWFGTTRVVVNVMGGIVALMGVVFLVSAVLLGPAPAELIKGSLVPTVPAGAGILVLGLVGTTIGPYNIFLGSGIARGQQVGEMRFGLILAVGLGGVISMAVVVCGAALNGDFSFARLADTLATRLGGWAHAFFAFGLFAAGFSSAITAPLGAIITARSFWGIGEPEKWASGTVRYRAVVFGVLLFGLAFGVSGIKPIPVIITAQALNGLVLPGVAVYLLLVVNDRRLMGAENLNGFVANILMSGVVALTVVIGLVSLAKAVSEAADVTLPPGGALLSAALVICALLAVPLVLRVRRLRAG